MNHDLAELDVDLLEPLLREFCRLIGLPATLAIVEAWGGLPLYIAELQDPGSQLSKAIGYDQARVLGREFGGERPMIPKAGRALRALRDQRIRREHSTKSIRQLVLDYKLSERRVCEILAAGGRIAQHVPGLFDDE